MSGKIIFIIGAVALVGGGAYLYMNSDMGGSSEEQLVKVGKNMAELDSLTVETDVSLSFTEEQMGEKIDVSLGMSSDLDKKNEASRVEVEGSTTLQGLEMSGNGSFTYIDDNLYGRIETFPTILLQEIGMSGLADQIMGVDILIAENISEREELEDYDVNEEELKEMMKALENFFADALEEDIVKVDKTEEDTVDGKKVDKHTIVVDYKKIPDFLLTSVDKYEEALPEEVDKEEVKEEIEKMKEEIENLDLEAEGLKDIHLYVWSDGKHILKASFFADVDNEQGQFSVESTSKFSNFNEEFDIVAPEDYKTMEDLMGGMMSVPSPTQTDSEDIYPEDVQMEPGMDMTEEELEKMMEEMESLQETN